MYKLWGNLGLSSLNSFPSSRLVQVQVTAPGHRPDGEKYRRMDKIPLEWFSLRVFQRKMRFLCWWLGDTWFGSLKMLLNEGNLVFPPKLGAFLKHIICFLHLQRGWFGEHWAHPLPTPCSQKLRLHSGQPNNNTCAFLSSFLIERAWIS